MTVSASKRRAGIGSPDAVRAALLRYRVMAYIVGIGLIILVFIVAILNIQLVALSLLVRRNAYICGYM